MQAASSFADRLLSEGNDDNERLSQLYLTAYGRPPSKSERAADQQFLSDAADQQSPELRHDQRRREAWSALCQVVLAASEFIYVK